MLLPSLDTKETSHPLWGECGKSHKSEMIHDKLHSMNDPMLIILSLDVAESPINQAFSNRSAVLTNYGTEEEKLNIHENSTVWMLVATHYHFAAISNLPLPHIKPCGPIRELGLSDPPLTNL